TARVPRLLRSRRRAPRRSRRARGAGPCAPGERLPRRSSCEHRVAYPPLLLEEAAAEREPLLCPRPVSRHDVLELVPVGLAELPLAVVALAQLRIRHRQPELPDLGNVAVEELLPRLAVPLRLDAPQVHRVLVLRDRVAVELHERPPPPVERLLHQLELLG